MRFRSALAPPGGAAPGAVAWLEAEFDRTAAALARYRRHGPGALDAADRARLRPVICPPSRLLFPMISLEPAVDGRCRDCLDGGGLDDAA